MTNEEWMKKVDPIATEHRCLVYMDETGLVQVRGENSDAIREMLEALEEAGLMKITGKEKLA